jgi:hypothetical protein
MLRFFGLILLLGCAGKSPTAELEDGAGHPGSDDTGGGGGDDTGGGEDDTGGAGLPPVTVEAEVGCEPLAEGGCMLPWPSDRYLAAATSETGFRIAYVQDVAWENVDGTKVDVSTFDRLDGFSPSSQLLTIFDEPVDTEGTAFWDSIERSLEADHPTVLLDMETGERLPHWVENDARATAPDETIFFIRPIVRLQPDRRYGVAIRGLSGVSGADLPASPAFVGLRDGRGFEPERPELEARREGYEVLFDALTEAGVERDTLQQAWWFHTASDASTRGPFLAMRADAEEWLGSNGLGCTVESVESTGVGGRLIAGTVTVPWYLDESLPPASLVRDGAANPVYQGMEEIPFSAYIPNILLSNPEGGELLIWGHGLFGSGPPLVENSSVQLMSESLAMPMAATDWHGMSSKDLGFLMGALWDVSSFYMVGENLQQGMVIQNALTRTLMGECGADPAFQRSDGGAAILNRDPRFIGISQGSVLGGTFLTQSPDIERGALIVGGANFSFMIERSIHFNTYESLLMPAYGERLVTAQLMAFSQHVWDEVETAAYIGAAADGLEGVGPKRFVYLVAENDAQVPNLSSDIAVRIADMPVLEDSSYIPWGSEVISGPTTDSAFISFFMGDRDPPRGNESPDEDDGGHNSAGLTDEAITMIIDFFETGVIASPCGDPCLF